MQYPQCSAFKPSLGVDASELYEAGVTKYSSLARCCQKCVPASAVSSAVLPAARESLCQCRARALVVWSVQGC